MTLVRRAKAWVRATPWYTYSSEPYAPDGRHCPTCNWYTAKPWKFASGCAMCDEDRRYPEDRIFRRKSIPVCPVCWSPDYEDPIRIKCCT